MTGLLLFRIAFTQRVFFLFDMMKTSKTELEYRRYEVHNTLSSKLYNWQLRAFASRPWTVFFYTPHCLARSATLNRLHTILLHYRREQHPLVTLCMQSQGSQSCTKASAPCWITCTQESVILEAIVHVCYVACCVFKSE